MCTHHITANSNYHKSMTRTNNSKGSMTLRVLLLLTTTSCPIITTSIGINNVMVSAWSGLPPSIMTSRVTTSLGGQLLDHSSNNNNWLSTIRHPISKPAKSILKLNMRGNNPQSSNNGNDEAEGEERQPIAREGEWSAYLDENYDRIYYFNHESVSAVLCCLIIYICILLSCLVLCISIVIVYIMGRVYRLKCLFLEHNEHLMDHSLHTYSIFSYLHDT